MAASTPCTVTFSCAALVLFVMVDKYPLVKAYTTTPAITAIAMSIRVANIGEIAFLFFMKRLILFIFLSTPPR